LQEARAAARLGHEAIARVFDVGQAPGGSPYVVMELLEGETLAAVLDRDGTIPPQRAVQILLPIADALTATHAKGIVHRDIKPENVFLARTDSGRLQPKLIDFGVAKIERRSRERMTAVGSVVGSPAYVSPEQAMGEDVNASADIWSFCVVLYEAMRGAPPFVGDDIGALLRAIIDQPHESLSELGVADKRLSKIIDRGLAKSRAVRFESMDEVGSALALWLVESGVMEDAAGHSVHAKWLENRAAATGAPLFSPTIDSPFEAALGFGLEDTRPGGQAVLSSPLPPAGNVSTPRLRTTDFVGVPMVPSDLPPRPDGQPHQLAPVPAAPLPAVSPGGSAPPGATFATAPEPPRAQPSNRGRAAERPSPPVLGPEAPVAPRVEARAVRLTSAIAVGALVATLAATGGWIFGSCRPDPPSPSPPSPTLPK
jgi:serine/threonine-protein kinase